MINKLINPYGVLSTLLNSIENNEKISVFGCGSGEKLTILNESGKFILFVCENEKTAYEYKEKFQSINLTCEVLVEKDNFFDRFSDFEHVSRVLKKIKDEELNVLVVTPATLYKVLPSCESFNNMSTSLNVGQEIDVDEVKELLIRSGYERRDFLDSPRQFLVRGDVVDVLAEDNSYYRLMFSFGELEKIKQCNEVTLLPIKELDIITINASNFLQIDEVSLQKYMNANNSEYSNLLGERLNQKEPSLLYLPFATNMTGNIFDYVPRESIIAINDSKNVYEELKVFIENYNSEIREGVKAGRLDKYFLSLIKKEGINFPNELAVIVFQYITNANRFFNPQKVFNVSSSPSVNYVGNDTLLIQDLNIMKAKQASVVVCVKTNENIQKIAKLLDVNRISYNIANTLMTLEKHSINIVGKTFGVSANFNEDNVFIIGSDSLFVKPKKILKTNENSFSEAFLPETNDFVVHNHYGIGKYLGVKCLDVSGGKRDFFVVEYKNNDILYLPVENLSSLSKYVGTEVPKINKLGGNEFVNTKNKVKQRIKESAINLVKLYAERQQLKGFVYPKDDELMNKFEEDFGYIETADQLNAINDIKQDMENGRLMDRLVCGDVGFGKTEVALRCAFKTILAGKQVAFLCPTTILSQQHYNTCLVRLKNYGINVAVLNRFKSNKECEQIYKQISNGEVDIVVGTHKLLNKNVIFKNLGLLILDEEQKFGVEDKEFIKDVKNNVNVLTLSATPIPRTLHMSLTGIRDISIIETPPTSRIPVQVSVVEFDEAIVKNAISRELSRGGQVLVIYNKVESIYDFASKLKRLIGEDVVVDVAHGQMQEKELENAIARLYAGETDVFVSTTLIENGVDLPNANTLIVINSDMLGLSQLYQLKGRIGRGDKQAFAYFTYDGGRLLNETVYKRLEAISQYTSMGSGFKIALKDLEIRGGGNVLGVEQSGHMEKVGYALYLQLLNDAITEVKGGKVKDVSEVKVETLLPAYLPNDYESSYNARISLYQRISKIQSIEDLHSNIVRFKEVYGSIPKEVENLCKISLIRFLASNVLANKVNIKQSSAIIVWDDITKLNENVVNALSQFGTNAVSDMSNKPTITLSVRNDESIFDLLINFLQFCVE